jgi:hypothetical protein
VKVKVTSFSFTTNQIFMACLDAHLYEIEYICHSRCFGIRGGHGKSAFKLAVKMSVELGYVFQSLRL